MSLDEKKQENQLAKFVLRSQKCYFQRKKKKERGDRVMRRDENLCDLRIWGLSTTLRKVIYMFVCLFCVLITNKPYIMGHQCSSLKLIHF